MVRRADIPQQEQQGLRRVRGGRQRPGCLLAPVCTEPLAWPWLGLTTWLRQRGTTCVCPKLVS